jgi:serine/threonine protein phosphatase PrpC
MTITDKMCPNCGTTVYDQDVCPNCGTEIPDAPPEVVEVGERFSFDVDAGDVLSDEIDVEPTRRLRLELELQRRWAERASRVVFAARVREIAYADEADDSSLPELPRLDETWWFVEDVGRRDIEGRRPDDLEQTDLRFRTPIAESSTREGRTLLLYGNRDGISLETFVELQGGELSFEQVRAVFEPLLEAVAELHEHGCLHLRLAPSRIRIVERGTKGGVPAPLLEPDASDDETGSIEINLPGDDREVGDEWSETQFDETRPQGVSHLEARNDSTLDDVEPIGEAKAALDEDELHWLEALGIYADSREAMRQTPREDDEYDVDPRWVKVAFEPLDLDLELEVVFESIDGVVEPDDVSNELECLKGYAAPEFYRRTVDAFEPLIDIFSLGTVLYFLIAGRRPPTSVYTRHTPALPARNFRLAFPPGFDPVIKRSTRPDPESRYPDLDSMANAFEEAADRVEARHTDASEPRIDVAVERHIGIGKREHNPVNQDDVFNRASRDGTLALTVVADGVSTATYGSGDIASEMVVQEAERVWEEMIASYVQNEPIDPFEYVDAVIQRANERIVEYVNEHHTPFSGSPHEVMGTTALVALYYEGRVTMASVGDSRTYLQRGPGLEQLTIDHNLWTLSILSGMSADDSLSMPQGDALARCVGTFELEEGRLRPTPPGADIVQFPVAEGDTLLLTTDGLIDFAGGNVEASEENILATLLSEPNPDLACLELVLLANRGGGGDNIGVGVANFE